MGLWRMFVVCAWCVAVVHHQPTAAGDRETPRECHRISANVAVVATTENCTSPVALCTTGAVTGGGMANGVFIGTAMAFAQGAGLPNLVPATTLSFVADHKIDTPRGTIIMRGTGVFDTARGEYSEVDPISGGTGIFAGATGTLWLTGTSPDGGTSFAGPMTGRICLAR